MWSGEAVRHQLLALWNGSSIEEGLGKRETGPYGDELLRVASPNPLPSEQRPAGAGGGPRRQGSYTPQLRVLDQRGAARTRRGLAAQERSLSIWETRDRGREKQEIHLESYYPLIKIVQCRKREGG